MCVCSKILKTVPFRIPAGIFLDVLQSMFNTLNVITKIPTQHTLAPGFPGLPTAPGLPCQKKTFNIVQRSDMRVIRYNWYKRQEVLKLFKK